MLILRQAGYRYPSSTQTALQDFNATFSPGQLTIISGPTGCGKSTLLRMCAGLLQRHGTGELLGSVEIDGKKPGGLGPADRIQHIGFVSQLPGDQLVAGTVSDEIAFALESAQWTPDAMEQRIPEVLDQVGLAIPLEHPSDALSGGQQQRLVIAAAIAGGAQTLILDEPLAQLDPAGAQQVMTVLRSLADNGTCIIMVEHRLGACLDLADRLLLMANGLFSSETPAKDIDRDELRRSGFDLPSEHQMDTDLRSIQPDTPSKTTGRPLLEAQNLRYCYPGHSVSTPALDRASIQLFRGERVALLGANGAGKSTLLKSLCGTIDAGPIQCIGHVIDVPQDPDLALFCATVRDELGYGPMDHRMSQPEIDKRISECAEALSIADLLERPPQALSRGQRLRVAVAASLACHPDVLILDEPTAGQDREQVERMMTGLRSTMANGALLFATHDLSLARKHATRILVMEHGQILEKGSK